MTTRIAMIGVMALALCAAVTTYGASKKEEKQQAPQQTVSAKVGKPLRAAQELMQKQDWDGAYAKVQEALAIPERTPFEDFQIAEMLGYIELKREKYPEASAAFEQSIASGQLSPADTTNRLRIVTQLAFQQKDYPKAITYANKTIASMAEPDADLYVILGQAQYLTNDFQNAAASMAQAVEKAQKAGKPVQETWLQVQLSSYVKLQDTTHIFPALKQLAIAFPKKDYLKDIFNQLKRVKDDDRSLLHLYRLMFELNMLEYPVDYLKLAQLASQMGLPGEAIRVLERGKTDKKFTEEVELTQAQRAIAAAKTAAATDRKTLAALEQASGSRSGEEEVQLGIALANYEQYDKAAAALQRGIDKGGGKRPDQALLVLGQTLLKLNKPDESQAAFAKVEESAPLGMMAQLWRAYTKQPASPAT